MHVMRDNAQICFTERPKYLTYLVCSCLEHSVLRRYILMIAFIYMHIYVFACMYVHCSMQHLLGFLRRPEECI